VSRFTRDTLSVVARYDDPPLVPFAVGGTIAWAVAGLVLLPFHRDDWLNICLAGFLVGFVGLAVMIRHDRKRG
jgi:hypothetical protein